MTNQNTIDKLIEMRLTTMADSFRLQPEKQPPQTADPAGGV